MKCSMCIVVAIFLSYTSMSQMTTTVVTTTPRVLPDSLVTKYPGSPNIHSAELLIKLEEVSDSISYRMSRLNKKKYKELLGQTLNYYVFIDKKGNSKIANYYVDYINRKYFDKMIIDYLMKFKFSPAYRLDGNKRIYINHTKYFEIKIH